ncbi:hypothetical protein J2Z22_002158 [Paenibacillus forsythiae]|uniref:Fibronectin type-III domain-containing protein n=1 Tax=Paenibacillus forsythiae TaxID=365616 RepID=A0ABU3H9D7_9BACL|nr:fibronectin type III domain-containing protein [Paenibacillus forsythiae]MDT3426632.1 hypothetical protein [Paenibacillus forsythiae]
MKSWKCGASKLFLVLIMAVSFFAFQTSTFAASVGSQLTGPEAGWKRVNAAPHNHFYFDNTWVYISQYSLYQGTSNSKVSFNFKGTKIRLIAYRYPQRNTNNKIIIDGTTYTYSEYGTNQEKTLVFEKTGLDEGVHSVEIIGGTSASGIITINAVDIDSTGEIVDNVPSELIATSGNSNISLSWDQPKQADSYKIRYGVNSGDYTKTVTVTKDVYGGYVVPGLTNGTTYYFVVSATVNGIESGYSNEVSAVPQAAEMPGRAILTIYLTNGTEKEYDLSMTEVDAFIDWYDQKDTGVGPAKYAFNKTWNKGPFKKRTEYVIFDKILTFNVDEYSTEE